MSCCPQLCEIALLASPVNGHCAEDFISIIFRGAVDFGRGRWACVEEQPVRLNHAMSSEETKKR